MARQDALNVYAALTGTSTKDKLSEAYGGLLESIQKSALSTRLKNTRYSGDPTTGSVQVSRFVNSAAKAYGTARAAAAGDPLRNIPVTINIDTDKEIVEEIEQKDIRFSPVAGVVGNRIADHNSTVVRNLDTAFFGAIEAVSGAEVTLTAATAAAQLEELIQEMETLENSFVNGVDRDMMTVTLKPAVYGVLRSSFDTIIGQGGEEFTAYHGVKVLSNTRQTKDFVLVVDGAVAQPVVIDQYSPSRIPQSNAASIDLFYSYGTKVVAEDLVLWADQPS